MASGPLEKDRAIRLSTEMFLHIEIVVYVALGVLLSLSALLTLGSAALLLLEGMRDWGGTHAIFLIVDRLMFVLMLIEILHTVRGSVRSGALTPEPFLIIGLIASIRNVLVITLKSSGVTAEGLASTGGEMLFRSSIVELAVLGVLILIFVVSIYLLRRGHALTAANEPDQDRSPRAEDEPPNRPPTGTGLARNSQKLSIPVKEDVK
ncbi:phosphate-starvation-inducible PsiE family protein [Bradyrhizobium sp. URHD0069]|uniref:phosphate-starvation-inducible PsiE family protein n=1 Tax=Bradyrhizobium sp. URHD0069 TaxID=1380355 RepID=UPI000A4C74DB|nr:phosphate-starvation-inducible PsiE family protein [Bradyrhizobium sp. URHD0069]